MIVSMPDFTPLLTLFTPVDTVTVLPAKSDSDIIFVYSCSVKY